jgi:hypothetical protein
VSDFPEDRPARPLEKMSLDWRETIERKYQADPTRMHESLVYRGYWLIAAQLRIDHAAGRLGS